MDVKDVVSSKLGFSPGLGDTVLSVSGDIMKQNQGVFNKEFHCVCLPLKLTFPPQPRTKGPYFQHLWGFPWLPCVLTYLLVKIFCPARAKHPT